MVENRATGAVMEEDIEVKKARDKTQQLGDALSYLALIALPILLIYAATRKPTISEKGG